MASSPFTSYGQGTLTPNALRDPLGQKMAKKLGQTLPGMLNQLSTLPGQDASMTPSAGWASTAGVGTPIGSYPEITQGPVYTPQQTANQWNNVADQGRQAAMSNVLSGQTASAGKGFSSAGNPAAAEMERRSMMQYNAALPGQRSQFEFDAAKDNAAHLLKSQMGGVQRSSAMDSAQLGQDKLRASMLEAWLRNMQNNANAQASMFGNVLGAWGGLTQPMPVSPAMRGVSTNPNYGGQGGTFLTDNTSKDAFLDAQTAQLEQDLLMQQWGLA